MPTTILGIESTAHTMGIAVVNHEGGPINPKNTTIASNEVAKVPSNKAGYIPRKLAEHHAKEFKKLLATAIKNAGVDAKEIDAVAYSQGPGLGHCLHVGHAAAKSLSLVLGKPMVAVNHAVAHVDVGNWACGTRDPLVIYVSGGNTQIAALEGRKPDRRYRVYGETLDIGIGNFLDNAGRLLELDPPDAVGIMKQAAQWNGDIVELPYSVKGVDLAFSGMLNAISRVKQNTGAAQLCYSIQETAYAMLIEASERCLCHTRKKEVLMVGGVAQNPRLQEMAGAMCREHGAKFAPVPRQYAGDNGAMIAIGGLNALLSGKSFEGRPEQNLRIDRTPITW